MSGKSLTALVSAYKELLANGDMQSVYKSLVGIVLNHQKANFELWLLGQTKDVQRRYWKKLKDVKWVNEHSMPEYSIFEITLLDKPNFDNTNKLSESILNAFESLSQEIFETLGGYE